MVHVDVNFQAWKMNSMNHIPKTFENKKITEPNWPQEIAEYTFIARKHLVAVPHGGMGAFAHQQKFLAP